MTRENLTEWWARHLDGQRLTTEDEASLIAGLRADAALRAALVADAAVDGLLRVVTAPPQEQRAFVSGVSAFIAAQADGAEFSRRVRERLVQSRRRRVPRRRATPAVVHWCAAAMLVLTAGAVAWSLAPRTGSALPSVAVLDHRSGAVHLERTAVAIAVLDGTAVVAGDRIVIGDGAVTLRYPGDGTAIVLGPDTEVEVGQSASGVGKLLRLERGALIADVAPQPAGRPLQIRTAEGVATVVGTRFTLERGRSATVLAVTTGRVRLADPAERGILVEAGRTARADADGIHLVPEPPAVPAAVAPAIPEVLPVAPPAAPEPPVEVVTADPPSPLPPPPVAKPAEPTAADFLAREYTTPAGTTPYRLFVPRDQVAGKRYPLVLFLHGSGERGTDNAAPIKRQAAGSMVFISAANQATNPCFMLVPQCAHGTWTDAVMRQHIAGIIAELRTSYAIDAERIIITGYSLGGGGTWDQLAQNPTLYAAAVPIAGWGMGNFASFSSVPLWTFHAADDPTVKVAGTRAAVAALRTVGGDPIYTEYATGGHASGGPAYRTPGLVEWAMAQRRGVPRVGGPRLDITPLTAAARASTAQRIALSGTATADAGITAVTWTVGTEEGACVGTSEWSAKNLPLLPGPNLLRILATGTSWSASNGGSTSFSASLTVNRPPAPLKRR